MSKTTSIALIAVLATFGAARLWSSDRHHPLHGRGAALLSHAQRAEAADQANPGEGKILYYQDPMHPWYRSDKPGFAPDCGMKLVPVYASEAADQPKPGERKILYYQDAMNPSHHSDKPGIAPDGMKLVPVYASETPAAALPTGGRGDQFRAPANDGSQRRPRRNTGRSTKPSAPSARWRWTRRAWCTST